MKLFVFQYALGPTGNPFPGYLIQADHGVNVLVDTGFPSEWAGEPMPSGLLIEEGGLVVNRLAEIGLEPEDIDTLICTHLDPDHAGGHDRFPRAELIVQRSHYEAARSGVDRLQKVRSHWDRPELEYRLVDGDTEIFPGIEVIETSGHVPGHQSVLVTLPETGPVLLAVDALAHHERLNEDNPRLNPGDLDQEEASQSVEKLRKLIAERDVKLTIFGHDADLWPSVRKSPSYYS